MAATIFYYDPVDVEARDAEIFQVERPDNNQYLRGDGTPRLIVLGDVAYRQAEAYPDKWTRLSVEYPETPDILNVAFPPVFAEAEIIDSNDEIYIIEGFGTPPIDSGLDQKYANKHRLRIRKSDFALMELVRWDNPIVELDEDGEIVGDLPDEETYKDTEHLRAIVGFSRYNEDFGIKAPAGTDIVVELFSTWPPDGETNLSVNTEFGFQLSEPVPVMVLTTEPFVDLVITTDSGGYKGFTADPAFEPATTYTAKLEWGNGDDETIITTWSFTTR